MSQSVEWVERIINAVEVLGWKPQILEARKRALVDMKTVSLEESGMFLGGRLEIRWTFDGREMG